MADRASGSSGGGGLLTPSVWRQHSGVSGGDPVSGPNISWGSQRSSDNFGATASTRAEAKSNANMLGSASRARLAMRSSEQEGCPKPADLPTSWWRRECYAFKETFFSSNNLSLVLINLLIGFVPLGLAAGKLGWSPLSQFGFNFLAIMPLAAILGTCTEAMASHVGATVGGLMNATLGNLVEMSVTICALKAGLVRVVQMSLIGSVLSNLLLVLGLSFISASMRQKTTNFNSDGASSNISCLVLASLALVLPTVFQSVPGTTAEECLMLSRIIACVMAFVYVAFLLFQLGTHASFFTQEKTEQLEVATGPQERDPRQLSLVTSICILCFVALSVAVCSQYLVESIEGVCEQSGMPYAFLGLILLPIVGNAAEHTTAITAAYHDMIDLSMNVAIGSSTQISLFVIPFAVIVGWILDEPLSLNFELFDTTVFILSVFIASGVLQDGKGNWFEGLMLVSTYVIVATTTWFVPEGDPHRSNLAPAAGVYARALGAIAAELGFPVGAAAGAAGCTPIIVDGLPLVYV